MRWLLSVQFLPCPCTSTLDCDGSESCNFHQTNTDVLFDTLVRGNIHLCSLSTHRILFFPQTRFISLRVVDAQFCAYVGFIQEICRNGCTDLFVKVHSDAQHYMAAVMRNAKPVASTVSNGFPSSRPGSHTSKSATRQQSLVYITIHGRRLLQR